MKINAIGHLVKTKPIKANSNPIAERAKIDARCVFTKDYEEKCEYGL